MPIKASTVPSARTALAVSRGWASQVMSTPWVETDVRRHAREKSGRRPATPRRDGLALQVTDRPDAVVPEHLEAADVDPARSTMGSARRCAKNGPPNAVVKSIWPVARSCHIAAPISADLTYFPFANPSPRSMSSATNCGAAQRLELSPIRSVVVSSGGSASVDFTPSSCVIRRPRSAHERAPADHARDPFRVTSQPDRVGWMLAFHLDGRAGLCADDGCVWHPEVSLESILGGRPDARRLDAASRQPYSLMEAL